MTTKADALEVMLVVQACHHRTAPRQDDPQVSDVMAQVWADLFSVYQLELADLKNAVKRRALREPGCAAPEPGEVVRYAREIRQERAAREQAEPEARYAHEARIDAKVAALVAPLAKQLGRTDRPAIGQARADTRTTTTDPDRMATARAELDAIRRNQP